MLNELVQSHPADALDPEIAGQFAAIGIVKGKPFNPDARMRKILTEAAAVANAVSRAITFTPRPSEGFGYYGSDSKWLNSLFVGGYDFMTPPPEITKDGIKPFPSDGARKLNSRTWFFYLATACDAGHVHAPGKCGLSVPGDIPRYQGQRLRWWQYL